MTTSRSTTSALRQLDAQHLIAQQQQVTVRELDRRARADVGAVSAAEVLEGEVRALVRELCVPLGVEAVAVEVAREMRNRRGGRKVAPLSFVDCIGPITT